MFCDMVGSTTIGARLDPEDFRDVVAAYHRSVTEQVARVGGFTARYTGDGVLSYFGYPIANENDAECAVRAGIAAVEAVASLDTVAGPSGTLCARVGIATGLVIAGHVIHAGELLQKTVVGDAPNLASRLQSLAEPGTVVIDESTRRLIGGLFDYCDVGTRTIKGYDHPIRTWRVLRESSIDSRFEALRAGGASPLFGRDEELALLVHRWREVQGGKGRVVLLSGEAGIGKSRLAAALEDRLRPEPHIKRRFLCSPHHRDTLLHPVIGQLARAAGFEHEDKAATKLRKLASLVPTAASAEEFAVIADLLSLPVPAEAKLAELTPQRRKERTFATILHQLERLTEEAPVLAICEDLHWADPTTLELLGQVVEQIEDLRLLLVITTRPDMQPSWIEHPAISVQPLSRLDRRQANVLIDALAVGSDLPAAVRDQIIAHADGVPLFVEELTKSVLESGAIRTESGSISPAPESPVIVPSSLHASLMARLDRLADAREVAQMSAVIGREFSLEQLRSVFPVTEQKLHKGLQALVAADLIVEQGRFPKAIFSFRHALVQDAAYGSLLRDRRRALHHQVAVGLERDQTGVAAVEPELLAYHFAEAGIADRAIDYHLKAAERAMARCALAEMVSHLRRGIGLVNSLPDSRETRRRELALQVALGRGLIDQVGSASVQGQAAFVRARELCLELNETDLLLSVLYGLQVYHFSHAEPAVVIRYAQEILDLGHRTGRRAAILIGERVAGSAYLLLGRLAEARAAYEHLLALYEVDQDSDLATSTARDPLVAGCSFLAICLTLMGHLAQGEAISRRGLTHAETLKHAISVVFALRRGCVDAMLRRDVERVKILSARLLEFSTDHETFLGGPEGHLFHAWALLHEQGDQVMSERLQRSIDQLYETRTLALLPFFMAAAAELNSARGDRAAARSLLKRAGELVGVTGECWCQPEIMRLEAALLAESPADKAELLRCALARASEQGSRLWQLRCATDLAELLRNQGEPDRAREMLAPVYDWFTEGLDSPDLRDARVLLDELG
jgi:class 3 adenylate cyclase/tetratricopeptide (TPR) repeat protein